MKSLVAQTSCAPPSAELRVAQLVRVEVDGFRRERVVQLLLLALELHGEPLELHECA